MTTASLKQDIQTSANDDQVASHFSFTPIAVSKILEDAAARYQDKPALDFEGLSFSYTELNTLADKIAAGLQAHGVNKGTKVGIYMPNTHYSIAFYYAILKAGGTVVNYNPLYAIEELTFQVNNSETDILITLDVPDLLDKAFTLVNSTELKHVVICPLKDGETSEYADKEGALSYAAFLNHGDAPTPVAIDPKDDIAVLQYTGGTTGVPKAAMLTHANLTTNIEQFYEMLSDTITDGEERTLGILPLFHVFAMTVVMNCSIRAGSEILLAPRFDPKLIAPILRDKKPTIIPAVPAAFGAIAKHPAMQGIDLSYTKYCVAGGAPIPLETKELFEKNTGATVIEAYGLTEASPVTNSNPPDGVIKIGSIGPAVPGTIVEILSTEDQTTVLPTGETGEVCIQGPQIMKGYYKNPSETENVLKNGRLHTGDIGYMDADGYVFLLDRLKDMILVNGYNVYPTQVEAKIYKHPDIEECLVAGVPDEKRGEAVWAWIKPVDGSSLTDSDVKAFLKDKLSSTEIPRKIILRDTPLPKTSVGKLSRRMLLEEEGLV